MKKIRILWVDDEIDLLKLHVMFLEEKGYEVTSCTNGYDAIDLVKEHSFDIIFLDENMPGRSGLDTLQEIKVIAASIPVVMITKSEEEDIMEQAIGSKIADYLIKPVNPNQILLTIKKNVDVKRIVTEKTTSNYRSEFTKLSMEIGDARSFTDWSDVYKKLVYWELELERSNDNTMDEVIRMQKSEANTAFAKYVKRNYLDWFASGEADRPLISTGIIKHKVMPLLEQGEKVFFIVIDNLRYDQWKILQPIVSEYLQVESDELYCGILPTATQYARNAMFAGLMPSEIAKRYPDLWLNDSEEGGKNQHEEALLEKQLYRLGFKDKFVFEKVFNIKAGSKIVENLNSILKHQLSVIVYNFVDMLSHARTEMDMIRELANDDPAYRSLTLSWFKHSALFDLLKELSGRNVRIIITTDHGTIKVTNPIKVVGDRQTTTNLRYKQGRNLSYKAKQVFEVTDPSKAYLPSTNLSSTYIFAHGEDFFAYPNNYNYYVNYYKNTFQHGGISLEEMVIPLISLRDK